MELNDLTKKTETVEYYIIKATTKNGYLGYVEDFTEAGISFTTEPTKAKKFSMKKDAVAFYKNAKLINPEILTITGKWTVRTVVDILKDEIVALGYTSSRASCFICNHTDAYFCENCMSSGECQVLAKKLHRCINCKYAGLFFNNNSRGRCQLDLHEVHCIEDSCEHFYEKGEKDE